MFAKYDFQIKTAILGTVERYHWMFEKYLFKIKTTILGTFEDSKIKTAILGTLMRPSLLRLNFHLAEAALRKLVSLARFP